MLHGFVRMALLVAPLLLPLPAIGQDSAVVPKPRGLASQYPGDEGIEKDPRVLFADDFETGDVKDTVARWGNGRDERTELTDEITDGSPGKRSLRVRFGHLYTHFRPSDQVYVRYYMRFHPNFGYSHHLPFLLADRVPTPWPKGFAGKKPNGDEFFGTALDAWGDWGKNPPPGKWMLYTYWQEMKISGDGHYWGTNFTQPQEPPIERGRWYCLEMMIKANSAPDAADGEQAFWVDGRLVGQVKGMKWRSTDKLKINSFWLLHDGETGTSLNGDKEHAGRVYDVWFDDVVIATEYIGPVAGKPRSGKKVGQAGRNAHASGPASLGAPGKVVFSEKFENGAGGFAGGQPVDGALSLTAKGAEVWKSWSVTVQESTVLRMRLKPVGDVRSATILIWSDKLKDNCRYLVPTLKKGEWNDIEFRGIEARVGWDASGAGLEGSVFDNFKLFFEGGDGAALLLDDVEIRE